MVHVKKIFFFFSKKRLKPTSGKLSIPKIILPWWLKIHSILIFLIWRRGYNCCFPKSRTLGPSATPVRACRCSRHPSAPWVMSFHWMAVPSFWAAHPRSEMPSKGLGALAFKPSSLKHSAFFTHLPLHLTPGRTENRTLGPWTSGPTVRWDYLSWHPVWKDSEVRHSSDSLWCSIPRLRGFEERSLQVRIVFLFSGVFAGLNCGAPEKVCWQRASIGSPVCLSSRNSGESVCWNHFFS